VLGAGPHGRQVAHDLGTTELYDDNIDGLDSIRHLPADREYVIGALWPKVRKQIAAKVRSGRPYRNGIYLAPSAIVGHDTKSGEHVHVLAGAIVSHGCRLDDFATVATGANLCGEVHVKPGAFIGAGAIVIHGGITIGEGAIVGAGAVVIRDVPPFTQVVGNPSSPVKAFRPC
jgi:acetyltransferase-like isoleucine patch superfamily enzyme